jgi:uncharacterized cupin superfamily protein
MMTRQPTIKNFSEIEPVMRESPQGKFHIMRRNFSEALGAVKDTGPWNGGPPFDVEHVTLPAGKYNFPFHSHQAVWEFYWILSGEGFARLDESRLAIKAGDFFICPPGCAHQIEATTDLTYAVIANNLPADIGYYPDSNKWIAMPERTCFRESVDYYDGEEGQALR